MGKRRRNLIEQILHPDNWRRAFARAAAGRRKSGGYLIFKEHAAARLAALRAAIADRSYKPRPPREFWVHEPKARQISALCFADRVVQHALVDVIGLIFERAMLPQAYACRPGKGTHAGAQKVQATMRHLALEGRPVWALKTDFSRYFASIDRALLWPMIEAKISCRHTLWLIELFTARTGLGLPIGNLTSQLWANVYGTRVDRMLAQTLHLPDFVRYMDDIVLLHNSRALLESARDMMEWFCEWRLGLRFSHWSIQPVERGVNFLGYRIFPGYKLLRRDSVRRAKRRIASLTKAGDGEALQRFVGAWSGHARWADSHHLRLRLGELRRSLSRSPLAPKRPG